jgi:hypothetical protein
MFDNDAHSRKQLLSTNETKFIIDIIDKDMHP